MNEQEDEENKEDQSENVCSYSKDISPDKNLLLSPLITEREISPCKENQSTSDIISFSNEITNSEESGIRSPSLIEKMDSNVVLGLGCEDTSPVPRGVMEEHLLMLHLYMNSTLSEEITASVLKVVACLQTELRSAKKEERNHFLIILGTKDSRYIRKMFSFMEVSNDPVIVGAICGLIHECLAPLCDVNIRSQFIRNLVVSNAVEVLYRCFNSFPQTLFLKNDLGLIHGFQIVAKLASKDIKMAVKCRLVGWVKFTHQLIQAHSKNNQLLLPLLLILKALAKNPTNQVVLGKEGCVGTLITLLNNVPKTHWAKIKLIIENLALLTKTTWVSPRLTATIKAGGQKLQVLLNCFFESNVVRLVRENGVLKIISLLECWEKIDKRHQNKVLRSLFFVLSHLCDSKHGRKAVLNLKGDDILHKFIMSCPSDSRFDSLLGFALNVFLKCSSKGELPVMSLKGAITFKLGSRESSPQTNLDVDQESSDEDEFGEDDDEEGDLKGVDLTTAYNPQTTRLEDLIKMSIFFSEFSNLDSQTENSKPKCTLGNKDGICELYLHQSSFTRSLINFVKVAYPDMVMAEGPNVLEPLYHKNSRVIREKVLRTVDRVLNANNYQEKVVFDLDYLLESDHSRQLITPTSPTLRNLSNWDAKRVGKKDVAANHLNFESRFESGNLRRAIQIAPYEYDLVLNSDVNSWHHHQWFYFEMSNMEANVPYIINIINNEKPNSEFNFGMKPVIFSVKESLLGRSAWVRTGYDICYHKNHFVRFPKNSENIKFRKGTGKSYYTVSITISFPHSNDVVYLAYHYPYTFTKLQAFLSTMESDDVDQNIFYRNQRLCSTLNGNSVPLLTITSINKAVKEKEVIFLTARVHPGESNSSWVMQGTIRFLLSQAEEAKTLRDLFVFKIVPMLNPEGVIHGNQRCGLTDEDLNRRWKGPNPLQHPTIYNTKALIEHLTAVIGKRPLIFCDFHGHSRQKNVFMYGCSRNQSWWHPDKDLQEDGRFMILPRLAQLHMRTFSLSDCRFDVERAREATARVAVWRQFQVKYSYTMEASTCGCDQGPYKNYHLSPKLLLDSGEGFCHTLYHFGCQNHSLPKSFAPYNRLSWTPSDSKSSPIEIQELPSEHKSLNEDEDLPDLDYDSEDDLDFELYGMSLKKKKPH